MFSKIVDVCTSLSDVKYDSIIAISGFNMATTPEYLIPELYKQYNQQGHPKNGFIISDALPAVPGRALDQISEGLYKEPNQEFLRDALMPFLGFSPWLQKLVTDNRIECYGWPIGVAIDLNIGQARQYNIIEYLKLAWLDEITEIYLEFKGDVSYFVSLFKAAKAAKISVPQIINLLRIANNYLPSVQRRYNELQTENNTLESIITDKSVEVQNLNGQIRDKEESLETIKSECTREAALLQGLRQQTAKLESFVYNYKNNDEEYVEVIKSIENKISDFLSDKKTFLKIAIISVIESMRNNPEKYSALVYHNNDNQNSLSSISKDNNSNLSDASRQVILPPPPYDRYIIEHYKDIMLEEAEKLYNVLVDQLVCEVINESISKQSTGDIPSLAALSLEGDGNKQDYNQQNAVPTKDDLKN